MYTITYRTRNGQVRSLKFDMAHEAKSFARDIKKAIALPGTALRIKGPSGQFTSYQESYQ